MQRRGSRARRRHPPQVAYRCVVDLVGRKVDSETFPTTKRGNDALITWARRRGAVRRAGVEGTGSYGVVLARRLKLEGIEVFEVTRPKRKKARHRRRQDHTEEIRRCLVRALARRLYPLLLADLLGCEPVDIAGRPCD